MRRSIALWLALAACRTQTVALHPNEIGSVAPHLLDKGYALAVSTRGKTVELNAERVVEAKLWDGPPRRISVRDLLADCPPRGFIDDAVTRAEFPRCVLFAAGTHPIVVSRTRDVHPVVSQGVPLAAVGGVVVCAFACDGPWNDISRGALIVTGVVLVAGSIAVLYVVSKIK